MEEYALAVKGKNAYAPLPKIVAEQDSMFRAWQGNPHWRCSRLCTQSAGSSRVLGSF